jgi:hypothetical protein
MKESTIKDLFKKLIDAENRHDLPAVRAFVYEHEKVGDAIPTRAERPGHLVIPGPETIAGIQFDFHLVKHAETEDALVIGIPHAGILIVQDLINNRVHAFLGERSLNDWIVALENFQKLPYDRILPGHGFPGGPDLFNSMIQYLHVSLNALTGTLIGLLMDARGECS